MFGDQILNTETINESLSNRQSAKMLYLQKENQQLQQENEDLKEALKLNKEALRISYQTTFVQSSANTTYSQTASNTSKSTSHSLQKESTHHFQNQNNNNQQHEDFVMKLVQENEKLIGMLSSMSKERNKAQSIALLQEQIGEENSNFYQEQVAEREEKIKELRMLIQDKEYVIQEFEKAKGYYDYGSNVLVRIRDITTPNDQSIKLHNEIEHLRDMIKKLSDENEKLNETIFKREEHSRVLKQELLKIRLVIMNPVNYHKMKCFMMKNFAEKGDEDAEMCGAFYKEVENEQQQAANSQLIKQQQILQEENLKEQYEKQHIPLRPTRNANQPQTQRYGNQLPNNQLKELKELNEKIQKVEENFKRIYKLYRREVENNNLLVAKIQEIMKECDQCFQNNELLINSNITYQSQIESLKNEVSTFKGFQKKYFHLLKNHKKRNNSHIHTINSKHSINETIKKKFHERKESESTATQNQKTSDKEVNVSILDEDEHSKHKEALKGQVSSGINKFETIRYDLAQRNQQGNYDIKNILGDVNNEVQTLTKDQAKIYLLNLAKDLYVNTNIKNSGMTRQVLKQIEIGGYKTGIISLFRSKRSLSNPLDYVIEDEEIKYSLNNQVDLNNNLKKIKVQQKKLNQVIVDQGIFDNCQEEDKEIAVNLNSGQSGPFNLDMSVIIDTQFKLNKNKLNPKKFQKIAINSSFISNDDDIDDLN